MSNAVIISIPVLSGRDTRGVPVTLTWKGHRVGFSASGETGNGVIISVGLDKAEPANGAEKAMSANLSMQFSVSGDVTRGTNMSGMGTLQFSVVGNMASLTLKRLSSDISQTIVMSANMSSIWRAPVETGMRNYLVAAVKNKLYYGS